MAVMKILVTGSRGMLAHDLLPALRETHDVIGLPREDLNITLIDHVYKAVKSAAPDAIINCAAYTQVDRAEEERERAFLVNGIGIQNLALVCRDNNIPLLHISTDYVFDGSKRVPYTPFDNTQPINTYGESKLAGEKFMEWILDRFYIIRTSWLYGRGGNNFVSTVIRLARERGELRIVMDQKGSPTSTLSLARAIKRLLMTGAYGIYHVTDETGGGISWYDFAQEIVRRAGLAAVVLPTTSEEFPRPARRPTYTVLDTWTFSTVTNVIPEDWRKALAEYLAY